MRPMPTSRQQRIKIQRTYRATLEPVWMMWTRKEGLEAWWGPEGFDAEVRKLDVSEGGEFEYVMTATDPEQVQALTSAGLPIRNVAKGRFTEVMPNRRLSYRTSIDLGVKPYDVSTEVEFAVQGDWVKMSVSQDQMHDAELTRIAAIGLDQQFDKLGMILFEMNQGTGREKPPAPKQD
jgi:uncharacterized protein YndB with AHSA1/START domain